MTSSNVFFYCVSLLFLIVKLVIYGTFWNSWIFCPLIFHSFPPFVLQFKKILLIHFQIHWFFPQRDHSSDEPIKGILHLCYTALVFQTKIWVFIVMSVSLLILLIYFFHIIYFSITLFNILLIVMLNFLLGNSKICFTSESCLDAYFVFPDIFLVVSHTLNLSWKTRHDVLSNTNQVQLLVWRFMSVWLRVSLCLMFAFAVDSRSFEFLSYPSICLPCCLLASLRISQSLCPAVLSVVVLWIIS